MAVKRTWGRRLRNAGLAAVVLVVIVVANWQYAIGWHPATDRYPIQGVDVTEDGGAIDWAMVRAGGADFAYIRATVGAERRDARFAANWPAARAAGLRRGALHQFALCGPATEQANNFIVTVPRVSDALPAAVAIADDDACAAPPDRTALIDELTRYLKLVETHTGEPILLLITPAIEAKYDLSRALDRTLWATGSFFTPEYLNRRWRMWRANGARRIEGAERPVGWDVVAP